LCGVKLSRKDSEFYLNEIRKYKEFTKFNELIGILEGLGANEDFIAIAGKVYNGNDFDWDFRKTPFYEGAYEGLDFINQTKDFNPELAKFIVQCYIYGHSDWETDESDYSISLGDPNKDGKELEW
jgi:hypothetical protein